MLNLEKKITELLIYVISVDIEIHFRYYILFLLDIIDVKLFVRYRKSSTMERSTILQNLEELGLSSNEAAVFCASTELGATSIKELAIRSGVKRTTVYAVVDSLRKKGLVRKELVGFKTKIVAESPKCLHTMLERKQTQLDSLLPHLTALRHLEPRESTVRYYIGMESLRSVYLGLLDEVRPQDDYLVLSDQALWWALDSEFFKGFLKRRAKLSVKVRMIFTPSPKAFHSRRHKAQNEEIRILPKGSLTTNLVVLPHRILIHQLVPPVSGLVIENSHIVTMHREMFNHLWDSLTD